MRIFHPIKKLTGKQYLIFMLSMAAMVSGCHSSPVGQSQASIAYGGVLHKPAVTAEDVVTAEDLAHLFPTSEPATLFIETDNLRKAHTISKTSAPKVRVAEKRTSIEPEFWETVRSGFQLKVQDNKRLNRIRAAFIRDQYHFDQTLVNGEPYLYHIYEEVKKRGLPMELVLLPMVESAFNPFAHSHSNASGIWQFIPSTGRHYGLKQNWWYDGRRDILAATDAALDHLEKLHRQFKGDWLHALAAYNSGASKVRKAIRRNKRRGLPTDFWSLRLPRETRNYVPRLLALAQIFDQPERYGISLREIPLQKQFERIHIGSQLDLGIAAQLAHISVAEMYRYNPGFNRWATSPHGPHYLLIPKDKADRFRASIKKLAKHKRMHWDLYRIKPGDTLGEIAQRNNTTIAVLKRINNIRGNRIVAGKRLRLPRKNLIRANDRKIYYVVKRGDSLWTISRKYRVTINNLAKWNRISPSRVIRKGQKLAIWQPI